MHYFKDFKGFQSAEINLFRPLTVLIGPNGAGKSNVIEGIELLSFIARGRYLHEIGEIGRGGEGLEVRGGLKACARFGSGSFTLGFGAGIKFGAETKFFRYDVTVRIDESPRILSESLRFVDDDTLVFETLTLGPGRTSGDVLVSYNNFDRGKYKPQESVAANRSVLSQYLHFAGKNKRRADCEKLIEAITKYLRSSFVFDPRPSLMRKYEKTGDNILQRNGSNLSSVLFSLKRDPDILELLQTSEEKKENDERAAKLERLKNWICGIPDEEFTDFDFVTTRLGDVIFGLKTADGGSLVDASLLSDGTLRSLAFLAALETVDQGARIVMEEFDNGVHPSRVSLLVKALAECSERRKLNVLVTTHNPATLNALQGKQLEGVVFSVWSKSDKSYKLVELNQLPRLPEFLEGGKLGDLVTRKVVEEFLAPNFDEEKKRAVQSWISRLS